MNYDEFLTTVLGGAIAGGVGVVTLWYARRLADRERLDEETLRPVFNYVEGLPRVWPWTGGGSPPWKELDRYNWYKIPSKFRQQISELETLLDAHAKLTARWWDFKREKGDASFSASIKRALSGFVLDDGSTIRGRVIGIEQDVVVQVQGLVDGVVPLVLLNPKAEASAWEQLKAVGSDSYYYWEKRAIRALQETNRPTLTKLFDAIDNDPEAVTARPIAVSSYESFGLVVQQANVVRSALAARLGLKVSSAE